MNAIAISNNDMVYIHWSIPDKIPNCLGFSIIRHDAIGNKGVTLPAMVGFKAESPSNEEAGNRFRDTDTWPVQKYSWKDLFAERGGTYWYEIVPMIGTPDHLSRDESRSMRTNSVSLSPAHGDCSVFFNRGIISTQSIAHSLPKSSSGLPNSAELKKDIAIADSPIRAKLVGRLEAGVLELLDRVNKDGGEVYCALYELSDADLIGHLTSLPTKNLHLVLSNAGDDTEEGNGDGDSTNADARKTLHSRHFEVEDRMLKKGHIGHNKFVVYVDRQGSPRTILSGSTNWTSTGLCAQSNNAIIVESPDLAADYLSYWNDLKKDTDAAKGSRADLQGEAIRTGNRSPRKTHDLKGESGRAAGSVQVWFSPSTQQKNVPRRKNKAPPTPVDLAEVFQEIENARQGVLFLAFIPGNPSIVTKLKEVYDAKTKANQLFYLRGAATSPDPASEFRVDLYDRTSKVDAKVHAVSNPPGARADAAVASVTGIFAAFAEWEAEIYKLGHAVIHDKILVIDPFTDKSVVVTGSHNLGFRASYCNDENLLIIRGNRSVAQAYAAHVLDVYEHYRWRWKIQQPLRDKVAELKKQHPKAKAAELWKEAMAAVGQKTIADVWKHLEPSDQWQDYYVQHKTLFAAETNFWSSFEGVSLATPDIPSPPAAGNAAGQAVQRPAKKAAKKPATKKTAKKTAKKTTEKAGKANKGRR
jgi:phosphatidylserine/phosphatidylglycerophosphate/cardiolipin synthase-like enzyme